VTIAVQANGGSTSNAVIDPVPSGLVPAGLPALVGWVAPNGYVVRAGGTADALGRLFLVDRARFSEISDHDPVVGETLTLPDEAVPPWLGLALDPPLPDPDPIGWFDVVPDDLLRAFHADGDPTPLFALLRWPTRLRYRVPTSWPSWPREGSPYPWCCRIRRSWGRSLWWGR
jgi:hypothetical protein